MSVSLSYFSPQKLPRHFQDLPTPRAHKFFCARGLGFLSIIYMSICILIETEPREYPACERRMRINRTCHRERSAPRHRWFNPGIVYIARVSAFDTCRSNSRPQNAKRTHVRIVESA